MTKKIPFLKNFNWRLLLVRILINTIALLAMVVLVPNIQFVHTSTFASTYPVLTRVVNVLILAIGLGVLNAVIKPFIQVVTFQFVFASYGLLLVVINTLLLYLLGFLFPNRFDVTNLFWALVGGALLGVFSVALEALFGTSVPIVPEDQTELRARLENREWSLYQVIDEASSAEETRKAEEALSKPGQSSEKPVGRITQAVSAATGEATEIPTLSTTPSPPLAEPAQLADEMSANMLPMDEVNSSQPVS